MTSDLICLLTQPTSKAAVRITFLSNLSYQSPLNLSPFVLEGSPKKEIHTMIIQVQQSALQDSSQGGVNFDRMLVSYITILRNNIYIFLHFISLLSYSIISYCARHNRNGILDLLGQRLKWRSGHSTF